MKWICIKTSCKPRVLDTVCAVMSVFDAHLQIEDASDIVEANPVYGELIDETLLQKRDEAAVSIYLPEDQNAAETASLIRERLYALDVPCSVALSTIDEQDWADNWKKYYKTLKIGKRLVIVPEWEEYSASDGEVIVKMDPGMAFGTGTHESTQLCAGLLEEYMPAGTRVLDIGTGSGILAIAASKLGASSADGFDIDPDAVRIAAENAALNGCSNVSFARSDLLSAVKGVYGFATANITAEIVMRLSRDVSAYFPAGGMLAVSGVIDEQSAAVTESMKNGGMELACERHKNGWSGLLYRKMSEGYEGTRSTGDTQAKSASLTCEKA